MIFYVTLSNGRSYSVTAIDEYQARQKAIFQNVAEGRPTGWVVSCSR